MKLCYKCNTHKPVSEFSKNKTKKDGRRAECKTCMKDYVSSIKGKSSRLFSSCKRRANLSGGALTITREWIEERLNIGVCEVTGISFNYEGKANFTRQPCAPSVDRKDSQNPDYTPENSRLVLWAVNCAMAEYGEKIMFPIFKAIVKNATKKPASPVPTGNYREGEEHSKHGALLTAGTREDHYDLDHYQRTVSGQDADYRAQTRGGDSLGHRNKEVGTFVTSYDIQNNGLPCAENILAEHRRGHIPDQS